MIDNSDDKIKLTEIFMAKAGKNGWDRRFHGTIKRDFDADGNSICFGEIKVNNGYIVAMGKDQWELGERLDELVLMVLDYGLHLDAELAIEIVSTRYFLN